MGVKRGIVNVPLTCIFYYSVFSYLIFAVGGGREIRSQGVEGIRPKACQGVAAWVVLGGGVGG